MQETFIAKNLEEMEEIGKTIAHQMQPGETWGFSGDLGAGKTTLVQTIGRVFGIMDHMTSPTFVLRKEYELPEAMQGIEKIVHVDAYRIEGGSGEDLGDLHERSAVTLIEWPEKLGEAFLKKCKRIEITIGPAEERILKMTE